MTTTISLEQLIARISELIASLEAQAFQQAGFAELSMRQIAYLEAILSLTHPSFGELAQALGVSRPSVTSIVSRLARLGYVQKIQDPDDLRSFHIVPTGKGLEFSHVHAGLHQAIARALTARLEDAEIQQLAGLISKALGE